MHGPVLLGGGDALGRLLAEDGSEQVTGGGGLGRPKQAGEREHRLHRTADRRVEARLGLHNRVLDSGCCGLAGNFGFERGHFEVSEAIAERVLLPEVRAAGPDTVVLADGFSCRTQIAQLADGRRALHLAELIARELRADG